MKKSVKVGVYGLGGAVCVIALTLFTLNRISHSRHSAIQQRADAALAAVDETAANETVRLLDQQLLALGWPGTDGDHRFSEGTDLDTLSRDLNTYFQKEVQTAVSGPLPLPPESVQTYLAGNEDAIDDLTALLLSEPALRWAFPKSDVADISFPLPTHQVTLALHGLLLARGVSLADEGESERAIAAIEAAHQLQTGFFNGQLYLDVLIGNIAAQRFVAVTRQLKVDDIQVTHDLREQLITNGKLENWLFFTGVSTFMDNANNVRSDMTAELGSSLAHWQSRDIIRLFLAEEIDAQAKEWATLESLTDCAAVPTPQERSGLRAASPFWLGNHATSYQRVIHTMLAAELNQKIAQIRTGDSIALDLTSAVCPGENWIYEKQENGFSIHYGGATPWVDEDGNWLPLQYNGE